LLINCLIKKKPKKIMEGYCVKCKSKKEIKGGAEVTMKNGRKAMKGKCPTCGTGMFRILGKA
jgi:Zn finger protein HypA/HybF involved in hydrogenase expression